MPSSQIVPVIMCGGAGTRLWPVSRESMPKQFVPLVGPNSTFQQVLARINDPALFARPIVITNTDFRFVVAEQLREREHRSRHRARAGAARLRPRGRGRRGARAPSAIRTPSCWCSLPTTSFASPTRSATHAGRRQKRRPRAGSSRSASRPRIPRPITAISAPARALNGAAVHAVAAFVEKPDAATAAGYVADRYLWNSGNFLFHAGTMLDEIERFEPEMAEAAKAAVAGLTRDLDFLRLADEPFSRAPKKSIDYAVMERTKLAAVVPADLGWSDVGSWSAVWDVLDHDDDGNAVEGPVVLMESRNSLVRSDESVLTTVVGLDDVVVVATADAVLVTSRAKAEGVKALVERLKAQNRSAAVEHRRIYRPWGYYQDVDLAERYRVKRIVVKPGGKLSLQKHFHRSEHWVVVKGTAEVTVGTDIRSVHENESIYIPLESMHRLANPGRIPLELIEVQVGSYVGEDDIVRFDDVYGRG